MIFCWMGEDSLIVMMAPRRLTILTILEDGPKTLQEISAKLQNIPLSILMYDLEQLRARGLVLKRGSRYFITDRGSRLLSEVSREYLNGQFGLSALGKIINILSLRSVWTYMYYISPWTLIALSLPMLAISLTLSWLSNVKLILLIPYSGISIPWFITPISVIAYAALYCTLSYRLKPMLMHLKEAASILTSLVPVDVSLMLMSTLYYFTRQVTGQLLIPFYIIGYLAPVVSITMLATWTALDTGVNFEHMAAIYLLTIYMPSSIIYLIITNA